MQDGVPFAAVAGDTDIKQSGNGTVDGIDRCTVCITIAFLTK